MYINVVHVRRTVSKTCVLNLVLGILFTNIVDFQQASQIL